MWYVEIIEAFSVTSQDNVCINCFGRKILYSIFKIATSMHFHSP